MAARLDSRGSLLSDPSYYQHQYDDTQFDQPQQAYHPPAPSSFNQPTYHQQFSQPQQQYQPPQQHIQPVFATSKTEQYNARTAASPPPASPPPQAQPSYNAPTYNRDYSYRDAPAPSTMNGSSPSQSKGRLFSFMGSTWPRAFFIVTLVQCIICLGFEGYAFAIFQTGLAENNDEGNQSDRRTIPTFLALFIFCFVYQTIVVWDALRMKNTIQIIGVCIANLAIMIYAAIQIEEIGKAINELKDEGALDNTDMWNDMRPFLVAIPGVFGLGTILMSFIAWKLYQVFAWDILKTIGADYRMKQRFLHYQVYLALLKFDFFFFLGFTVQFLVIVGDIEVIEYALTAAAIPITIGILMCAAYFTRREFKTGVIIVDILYLGGLSYFIFKLVRIYQPNYEQHYQAVRKSLTAFTVITILLIILTIINSIICMRNFGHGLKDHLIRNKQAEKSADLNSISLQDVKPQMASRMTID